MVSTGPADLIVTEAVARLRHPAVTATAEGTMRNEKDRPPGGPPEELANAMLLTPVAATRAAIATVSRFGKWRM
jgi:hypothetical protein